MNKTLIKVIPLLPFIAYGSYIGIISKQKNEYLTSSNTVISYTEWNQVNSECTSDILEKDVYFGLTADQTQSCIDTEERTKFVTTEYSDGTSTTNNVLERKETHLPDQVVTITGTHLENSCNNIITKGYANTDGVYQVGVDGDSFDVYCDMRNNEGWTLIAKSPVGDSTSGAIPNNWFATGYNSSAININTFNYNDQMSSLGTTKIKKIGHTGIAEFVFVSEDQSQKIPFYKTFYNASLDSWFHSTENYTTTVCTDKNMSQNCESSTFENYSGRYWLRGMDLRKYGFSIIDEVVQDIHYNFPTSTTVAPTLCSVTGNLNNNAWHDSAVDGHWGNGLIVYIK